MLTTSCSLRRSAIVNDGSPALVGAVVPAGCADRFPIAATSEIELKSHLVDADEHFVFPPAPAANAETDEPQVSQPDGSVNVA